LYIFYIVYFPVFSRTSNVNGNARQHVRSRWTLEILAVVSNLPVNKSVENVASTIAGCSLGQITSSFLWHIPQDQLTWTAWVKISFALTNQRKDDFGLQTSWQQCQTLDSGNVSVALLQCECVTRWMWWTWWW